MADAPNPAGQPGDTTTTTDAASAEVEAPKTYTQQQVEAIVAQRLRNSKKAEAELRAQLAEASRKKPEESDNDDADDDEPDKPADKPQADPDKRWRDRMKRIRDEHETERKALLAQVEEAKAAHNRTQIEHALMTELSKRGNVGDIPDVMELTAKKFDFVDGQVVPKDDDATTVSEFYDKWLTAHKRFIVGPPSGDGQHSGRLPGAKPAKRVADMTEAEAAKEATKQLFGHLNKH